MGDDWRRAAGRKAAATRSWRRPTLSEKALADELVRSSPYAWRREVPFDAYRLDFYCAAARLAVEVDGSSHARRASADATRDAWFAARGIVTLRIDARDVERDVASVVARLNRECLLRTGRVPSPPRRSLADRVLRRPLAAPAPLAPPVYEGRRRGGSFVCARCRTESPPRDRSPRTPGTCVRCAG